MIKNMLFWNSRNSLTKPMKATSNKTPKYFKLDKTVVDKLVRLSEVTYMNQSQVVAFLIDMCFERVLESSEEK